MDNEKVERYLKKFETFLLKNDRDKKEFQKIDDLARKLIILLIKNNKEYILSDLFINEITLSANYFIMNLEAINKDLDRGLFYVVYEAIVDVFSTIRLFGRFVGRAEEKVKHFDLAVTERLQEAVKISGYACEKLHKNRSDMMTENTILVLLLAKCIVDNKISSFNELAYCFVENIPFILDDLILNGLIKDGFVADEYNTANRVIQKIDDNEVEIQIT